MHSRNQLAQAVAFRYWKAAKKEKSVILQEFCLNTGYERKYAIKKLRKTFLYRQTKYTGKRKRNKPSKYMIIKALVKHLWETADYPSGTRLYGILPELIEKGIEYGEINPNAEQKQKL